MILIREKICKKKFDVIKDRKYIRNIAENKSRETKSCGFNWLIGKKCLFKHELYRGIYHIY